MEIAKTLPERRILNVSRAEASALWQEFSVLSGRGKLLCLRGDTFVLETPFRGHFFCARSRVRKINFLAEREPTEVFDLLCLKDLRRP